MQRETLPGQELAHIGFWRVRAAPVRRGFTLIELLVVIAVITVLMGIVLPAVGRARELARRAKCASNLRQVGQAVNIYSNTFREYLPSYNGWGMARSSYRAGSETIQNYSGHQGVSRHLVIGYSEETNSPETDLAPGAANFMPVGLGYLVARGDIGAESLSCPSMYGTARTWFGSAYYAYTNDFASKLGFSTERPLVTGDGRNLLATPTASGKKVVGVLSSYAYRNTPFYSRLEPANAPEGWTYTADHPDLADPSNDWTASWFLPGTRPRQAVSFMTPPFKTLRTLGNRALCSDGFDLAPEAAGGDFKGRGLAERAHGEGYHVLYGDGHAEFFADDDFAILEWNEWADPDNPGTDNLTISSMSSQKVWNLFDRSQGIDEDVD